MKLQESYTIDADIEDVVLFARRGSPHIQSLDRSVWNKTAQSSALKKLRQRKCAGVKPFLEKHHCNAVL